MQPTRLAVQAAAELLRQDRAEMAARQAARADEIEASTDAEAMAIAAAHAQWWRFRFWGADPLGHVHEDFPTVITIVSVAPVRSDDPVYRGSLSGRAAALDRKRERGHDQLYNDYFQPTPLFPPALFRRRFRMSRPLFRRIMDGVKIYDDYFCAKVDAIDKVLQSWEWKNCPFGWQGAYNGHPEGCTVIVEAVASHDTWIWYSFFGMAGSHNDINVLQRSPVFDRLAYGQSPDVDFEINGHHYTKGYYLADGIYPPWATLVKTIRKPNSEQEARFAKEQEAARKDVERAFDILQSRWAIDLTDPNDKEAIAERIILVKGKVEELYGISSSIERHLIGRGPYVRFNRKVVSELSSLVDPKPEDPVWTQMQTSRIRTKFLKFAGFILYSYVLLHLPQLHNKKDEKTAMGPGGMGEVPIA
ncbi:hypothetical protein QYE76_022400 [Lolium multiflorum]|uniref:Uncharacterized protein n=1 Tax=Lolium multiflorum TaxID=4521 RepID=A0AAD8R8D1_LOLMU|nr:hypothetical protein QYE76_022400 [Lolium multiflorum]